MKKVLDLLVASRDERNSRLNEVVAEQLAGYRRNNEGRWVSADNGKSMRWLPPFTTDASIAIMLLPQERHGRYWTADGGYLGVRVCIRNGNDTIVAEGAGENFALAACLALLRADGWEILL